MFDQLQNLLKYFVDFDKQQLGEITKHFKPKLVKKNTLLLSQGEVCNEFYFIYKGCIRTYFLDKEGNEKTRYVMCDSSIGTALTSFISKKPSFEFIEALEDTQLLVISHQDFYKLNEGILNWKIFYQKILEMAYSFQNKKIEGLVTLSAKQRYELLLNETPILVQLLSNRVLASYIDVKPETLSRLKSK